jgi:hypothetical protein
MAIFLSLGTFPLPGSEPVCEIFREKDPPFRVLLRRCMHGNDIWSVIGSVQPPYPSIQHLLPGLETRLLVGYLDSRWSWKVDEVTVASGGQSVSAVFVERAWCIRLPDAVRLPATATWRAHGRLIASAPVDISLLNTQTRTTIWSPSLRDDSA